MLSDNQRDCRRYCGVFDDDGGFPSNVPAFVDDVDVIFAQEALCETSGGSFLGDDRLVISTAL